MSRRLSSMIPIAAFALFAVLGVAGCKQGIGDRCEQNSDCSSGFCNNNFEGAHMPGRCESGPSVTGTGGSGGSGGTGGSAGDSGTDTATDAPEDAPTSDAALDQSVDTGVDMGGADTAPASDGAAD